MLKQKLSQSGSTHMVVLLIIIVVAVAAIGYRVIGNSSANSADGGSSIAAKSRVSCRFWTNPTPPKTGKPVTAYVQFTNPLAYNLKLSRIDFEALAGGRYGNTVASKSRLNIIVPPKSVKTVSVKLANLPAEVLDKSTLLPQNYPPSSISKTDTLSLELFWAGGASGTNVKYCRNVVTFKV